MVDKNKKWYSKIESVVQKLINSFDNHTEGFSARKLSAFIGIVFAAYVHYLFREMILKMTNEAAAFEYTLYVLCVDLIFVLVCLGIVTVEQVIKLKESKKTPPPTETTTPVQ